MPPASKITDWHRNEIVRLHGQGVGRNDIARTIGLSQRTVSRLAAEMKLSFDRAEATRIATNVRKEDLRAKRALLERYLLEDALKLRSQIWMPHEYIDHGGKEFVEVRWEQPEPSPMDKLKLMQAAGIAAAHSLKIAGHDSDDGVEGAKSMLGALAAALQAAADSDTNPPDDSQ